MSQTDIVAVEPTKSFKELLESGVHNAAEHIEGDFGEQLDVVDQKDLEGNPFIINSIRQWVGDFGDVVAVKVTVANPITISDNSGVRKVATVVFNDGGGVYGQVIDGDGEVSMPTPAVVSHGLRKSEFRFDEKTGKALKKSDPDYGKGKPATSWYLDARDWQNER